MSYFEELSKVDCSEHVEKKGKFTYLSWPFAVSELRKRHPEATWEVVKSAEGLPFTMSPAGCFVEVAVTVNGIKLSQIHPVLDNNNKTIYEPNAFQINTSIQRCLVKAIALHGLGLYIYAGEDLPDVGKDPMEKVLSDFVAELVQLHQEGHTLEAVRKWYEERPASTNEAIEYMWAELRDYSELRSAIKANKPASKESK